MGEQDFRSSRDEYRLGAGGLICGHVSILSMTYTPPQTACGTKQLMEPDSVTLDHVINVLKSALCSMSSGELVN